MPPIVFGWTFWVCSHWCTLCHAHTSAYFWIMWQHVPVGRCNNCKSILYKSISIHPVLGYSQAMRERGRVRKDSSGPEWCSHLYHRELRHMLLDTRDESWQGRGSEVWFSLCCLRVLALICKADSPRDAWLLLLEPFYLIPQSPPETPAI